MNDVPSPPAASPPTRPAAPALPPVPPGSRLENLGFAVRLVLDLLGSVGQLILFLPRRAAHRARLLRALQESDA